MLPNPDLLHSRRDPDPVSIVLATLGAVGSVASIISLAKANRRDRQVDERLDRLERASRSYLIEHLANAESALADLSSILAQVTLIAAESGTQELEELSSLSPQNNSVKFGEHGMLLDPTQLDEYMRLQDRAFRSARGVQKALSSAFRVLYRTESGLPEGSFDRFVSAVRSVNAILSSRKTTTELLIATQSANDQLKQAVSELRDLVSFSPPPRPTNRSRLGS